MALAARVHSIPHPVIDEQESPELLIRQVLSGLQEQPKRLSPRWLFDERGSALFDRLCSVPEFYLTRSELMLVDQHAADVAARIGSGAVVIEFGSGTSLKTRVLLDELRNPFAYVPVDLSRAQLVAASRALALRFPDLRVLPVCADFTRSFVLPPDTQSQRRRVIYLAGSTLGNFSPQAAADLLRLMHLVVGPDGAILASMDLRKDPGLMEAAYNDLAGVTARFNRNVLSHLNHRFDATFDMYAFRHEARWLEVERCIEMRLVSQCQQSAMLGGAQIAFQRGEPLVTARSYKYSQPELAELACEAGLTIEHSWLDETWKFGLFWLAPEPPR